MIVGVDEDKTAEIDGILAKGHNVIERKVVKLPPRILDKDELTPELKLIGERAKLEREVEAKRHHCDSLEQRLIDQRRREEMRPTPIEYFPLKY